MCIDPIILFFLVGIAIAGLLPWIRLPQWAYSFISAYLLIVIGLKGGIALHVWCCWDLVTRSGFVILLTLITAAIAVIILRCARYSFKEAIVIGAHYGSVSIGTYAVALKLLQYKAIPYEPYISLFVSLMEFPAIIVSILLLSKSEARSSLARKIVDIFCQKSVVLLCISILIGAIVGETVSWVTTPFFNTLRPILAIFLLEMGFSVGQQLSTIKQHIIKIVCIGLLITLAGAGMGLLFGMLMGLSLGGIVLMMVLASSASYIAVPASLKRDAPKEIPLALGYSLGVTFPFNILIGIDLYISIAQLVTGTL